MNNVMIDLETLGTAPGAPILSIGAVKFDPATGALGQELHIAVTLQSGVLAGMAIEPDTLAWWLGEKQAAARADLIGMSAVPLALALEEFAHWLTHDEHEFSVATPPLVWAKGADFDFPILATAFRLVDQPVPWKYWNVRCCRTLFKIAEQTHRFKVEPVPGTAHCALDDAKHQAQQVMACLELITPRSANGSLAA